MSRTTVWLTRLYFCSWHHLKISHYITTQMSAVCLSVTLITTNMADAYVVVFIFGQKSLFWTYSIKNTLYWCKIHVSNQRSSLNWWKFCHKYSKGCRYRDWLFWRKIHAGRLVWYQNHGTMWAGLMFLGYTGGSESH